MGVEGPPPQAHAEWPPGTQGIGGFLSHGKISPLGEVRLDAPPGAIFARSLLRMQPGKMCIEVQQFLLGFFFLDDDFS